MRVQLAEDGQDQQLGASEVEAEHGAESRVQLWPHEVLTADLGLNQGFEIDKLFREWDTEVHVLLTLLIPDLT